MKTISILIAVVALIAGAGVVLHQHRQTAVAVPAVPAPSAAVSVVAARRTRVPLVVEGYGDLLPAKIESVNFARPGILSMLRVVAGQQVRRGDPVARLGSDPLVQAAYGQARSALSLAEGELQRVRSLFALQLATASQVQTAAKAATDAFSNLAAQEKLGGGVDSTEVVAPFDGVVVAINAAQGDRLAAGAPVLQVGRTDRLKVQLGIEPSDRQQVRPGQSVLLLPLQSPAASGSLAASTAAPVPRQGAVTGIQDMVDTRTQLLGVTVELAASAMGVLVPGMRVHGAIRVGEQDGWTVPRSAVLKDDKGAYLFQVAGARAHRVTVLSVQETPETVVVSGPVAADQPVVSLGNYELVDGMAVREAKP